MDTKPKTALVVIVDGVEEMEAVTPIDLLRRAGIEVTVAGLSERLQVTGRNHLNLLAELSLEAVMGRDFDVIVLPGGPGVKALRGAPKLVHFVRDHASAGRLVAAICAAPTLLKDAGLLQGRRHTAHDSVEAELPQLLRSEAVVRDGNVITSRGAGTAIPFSLEIIRALVSDEAAKKVALSICHPH